MFQLLFWAGSEALLSRTWALCLFAPGPADLSDNAGTCMAELIGASSPEGLVLVKEDTYNGQLKWHYVPELAWVIISWEWSLTTAVIRVVTGSAVRLSTDLDFLLWSAGTAVKANGVGTPQSNLPAFSWDANKARPISGASGPGCTTYSQSMRAENEWWFANRWWLIPNRATTKAPSSMLSSYEGEITVCKNRAQPGWPHRTKRGAKGMIFQILADEETRSESSSLSSQDNLPVE